MLNQDGEMAWASEIDLAKRIVKQIEEGANLSNKDRMIEILAEDFLALVNGDWDEKN